MKLDNDFEYKERVAFIDVTGMLVKAVSRGMDTTQLVDDIEIIRMHTEQSDLRKRCDAVLMEYRKPG